MSSGKMVLVVVRDPCHPSWCLNSVVMPLDDMEQGREQAELVRIWQAQLRGPPVLGLSYKEIHYSAL